MPLLDESQREFCQATIANIRLLAPAGCGKTLCLLFRCKYLADLDRRGRPRFLIVTFTVAARQELQARLNEDSQFADLRDKVEITTLNSWGWRRVRNIAFSPKLITSKQDYHFAMLNQLQAVWQRYDDVKRAIKGNRNRTPQPLMNVVDAFKSLGFDHVRHADFDAFASHVDTLYRQNLGWRLQEQFDELTKFDVLTSSVSGGATQVSDSEKRRVHDAFFVFWREASAHLISNATFTLEDQKYVACLDEMEKLEERNILSGAARYDHVLVDEFQDINPLDLRLIKAIVERNRATLTIAGDDDQAIFEWRGATPEYILEPERYFDTPFETHTLGVNYRSPANIVELSQRLIANNTRRVGKKIRSSRSAQAQIQIRKTKGLIDALDYVQAMVTELVKQGSSPSRVAIIGRKRSQIIPYQVYFASKDIAFCAAEDLQIFLSGAFDRLLNLLMIKTRAGVRQSRSQVVNDMLQLCDLVKRYQLNKTDKSSLYNHLQKASPRSLDNAIDALAKYRGRLKGPNKGGSTSLAMAAAVREFVDAETVSDALVSLSENFGGLHIDLGKAEDDIFYVDPPFLQLAEYAETYGDDYDQFVDDIELAKSQLVYIPPFEDESSSNSFEELWRHPLHLMTALRAKGKEFDVVVLLGVRDGIWPNKNAHTKEQIEAERRVFYVAFTRARKKVVMLLDDRMGNYEAVVSPYIDELGLSV
ncbi:MAG: UvrD-helicase domain-containing protein [Truepera sp.]|nr:UvrD-helicase domain-containing protein [Truepera sp.]